MNTQLFPSLVTDLAIPLPVKSQPFFKMFQQVKTPDGIGTVQHRIYQEDGSWFYAVSFPNPKGLWTLREYKPEQLTAVKD